MCSTPTQANLLLSASLQCVYTIAATLFWTWHDCCLTWILQLLCSISAFCCNLAVHKLSMCTKPSKGPWSIMVYWPLILSLLGCLPEYPPTRTARRYTNSILNHFLDTESEGNNFTQIKRRFLNLRQAVISPGRETCMYYYAYFMLGEHSPIPNRLCVASVYIKDHIYNISLKKETNK